MPKFKIITPIYGKRIQRNIKLPLGGNDCYVSIQITQHIEIFTIKHTNLVF